MLAQRWNLQLEILPQTINSNNVYHRFKIEPAPGKTTWCYNTGHYITTSASSSTEDIYGNHCDTDNYGFRVCYAGGPLPKFWITLNKFTIYKEDSPWEEIIYFYIDYRDCNYGKGADDGGGSRDITILMDGEYDKAYYAPGVGPNNCNVQNYTEISEGETLKIWKVNDYSGSHDVSCMCATPTLESIINHF